MVISLIVQPNNISLITQCFLHVYILWISTIYIIIDSYIATKSVLMYNLTLLKRCVGFSDVLQERLIIAVIVCAITA